MTGIVWPALQSPEAARLLAVCHQLDASQWWPSEVIAEHQRRQLALLLAHAATIPFWQERLAAAGIDPSRDIDAAAFARLPPLTRRDIQVHGAALRAKHLPAEHGAPSPRRTGGSTGEPVEIHTTGVAMLFWAAMLLREHLWQRRDFRGKLLGIRSHVPTQDRPSWGPPADLVFETGPSALLNIRTDVAEQLAWLVRQDGDYLITHPTNLRALAQLALERGVRLPRLKEVRTFGETLPADLRGLVREAWDVRLTDVYSTEEVGHVALQCPEHEHYHVAAEDALVEVIDEQGRPCAPGETGRIVVTPLHNFAMPLIRYALGDYAEVGAPCPCGRGLPVLTRIAGRQRNMLVLPDGRRQWPSTPPIRYAGIAPVRQLQIVQKTVERLEARYAADRPLTAAEEQAMIERIRETMGHPFTVTLQAVDSIPRLSSNKFEDFVSEVAGAIPDRA
jgi:phenylacetate-CoA ligase